MRSRSRARSTRSTPASPATSSSSTARGRRRSRSRTSSVGATPCSGTRTATRTWATTVSSAWSRRRRAAHPPAFRPGSPIVIVARAAQQRATRHLLQRRKSLLASSLPLHYKPPTAPTSPRKAGRPPLIADAHHSLPAATACRTLLIQRYELRNLAGVRAVRELLHNRCATVVGRLPRRSCWARTSTGPVPWTSCPNHVLLSVRCSGHATWHLRPREACCAVREPSRDSARTLRTQGLVCELRVRLVCCGGRDSSFGGAMSS